MLSRGVPALTMNSGASRASEDTVSSASMSADSDMLIGFLWTYATSPELHGERERASTSRSARVRNWGGEMCSLTSHRPRAPTRSLGKRSAIDRSGLRSRSEPDRSTGQIVWVGGAVFLGERTMSSIMRHRRRYFSKASSFSRACSSPSAEITGRRQLSSESDTICRLSLIM